MSRTIAPVLNRALHLESRRVAYLAAGVLVFLAVALAALVAVRAWNEPAPAEANPPVYRTAVGPTGAELRATFRLNEYYVEVSVWGLAPPPPDRMYQLWLIPKADEVPRNLGLLLIQPDGVARAQLDLALTRGDLLTVTEEPAGGSTQPSTSPVVALSV
jgi:anti-sigma-K factor RskA